MSSSTSSDNNANSIKEVLQKNEIFPHVLDSFTPSFALKATFQNGREASLGNTIDTEDAQEAPKLSLHSLVENASKQDWSKGTWYAVMTDPDAPSRHDPKWSEFCHWILSFSPQSFPQLPFQKGDQIIEYMGPAPPEKTGKHRYVLVLLHGEKSGLEGPNDRKNWGMEGSRVGLRQWAQKHGLKPVAANFFFAQNKTQ
ncbi:PEBP-like protein [Atractiella rhizophila]|nr:PEBP-like protein [Atractiella rhizophila]